MMPALASMHRAWFWRSCFLFDNVFIFLTADVTYELFDHELLVGDDRLNDVADRDETNEFSVFNDGKMARAFFGH